VRPKVSITVGLSLGISLTVSSAIGLSWADALFFCVLLTSALAFGAWVLSADPRTDRLERLLRVLLERSGKPNKPDSQK
jgi:hypothetical protein